MSELDTPARRVGRPRDERAEKAIIDATVALVGEVGFGNLTVDAVAARASVGKATIYRRWSSKGELLLAALSCLAHEVEAPDTGSLAGDLAGLWGALADHVRSSEAGRAMPSLVAEAECNPELRAVLHQFVDRRRAVTRGLLERAQARGEVRDDIDIELAVDMFSGPIFYRRLVSGAPLRASDGQHAVQLLLDGIGEKAQPRRAPAGVDLPDVSVEIRGMTADDLPELYRTVAIAFGDEATDEKVEDERLTIEYDRMLVAVDSDTFVGGSGAYSFDLTLPGATQVPVAGVTWVGVLPTHRRQGILTEMMGRLLDDAVDRGEPIATLGASEAVIYGRYGYGIATHFVTATIPDPRNAFAVELCATGRIRFVTNDEAEKLLPPVFDAWRATRVGSISRNDGFWAHRFLDRERNRRGKSAAFRIVHESPSGEPDGYAVYRIKGGEEEDHTLTVDEVIAPDAEVEAALWRHLLDHDLNLGVETGARPVDDQLRWRLADSRAYAVTGYYDHLWLRVLDTSTALTARRYSSSGTLVLEVIDPFRPEGAAAGRFRLDASPDGATCVRAGAGDKPDVSVPVSALGSAYLGSVRFTTLAAAGRVTGSAEGLRCADALFAAEHAPFCNTDF